MYAIIESCGKQYKVSEGDVVYFEKLDAEEGKKVTFDKVVLVSDGKDVKVGTPYVSGVKVEGKVVANGKAKKILVYRYKAKKNVRRTQGHRQPYTKVEITLVGAGTAAKAEKAEKAEVKTEAPKKTVAKKATTKKETK
jgi:large subunit ribosomal protein L21